MNRLHRFAIRRPVLTVVLGLLVTAAIAPGILRLRLRTDGHALVPERAPAVVFDREVRRDFGIQDPLVVLIRPRHSDGILNPHTLRLVVDLTARLSRLPGADSAGVQSLATEPSDHFWPGTLLYRNLLDPLPESAAAIEELRGDLDAIRLFDGTLVSLDREATAILVGVPADGDRTALFAAAEEAVGEADTSGHAVHVIGAPAAEALLGTHILEDLGIPRRVLGAGVSRFAGGTEEGMSAASRLRLAIARHVGLLPIALLFMALVFFACFRSLPAVLLPLGEAGACLIFVFGLMGWAGVPVYLTIAVLPVILVSMGLADEIHVFSCYARRRDAHPTEPVTDAVRSALDEMALPVVATSLTTAIGFLSFAISPLEPVRVFGIFTAIGILFCMAWTLTVIPALLVLLAPPGFRGGMKYEGVAPSRRTAWRGLAAWASRRPGLTLAAAVLALTVASFGIARLVVQDSWIAGFARDSGFFRATQYFDQRFFGSHRLLLVLDTGHVDLRGALPAADLEFDRVRLPPGLVADPRSLVGCSLVITKRAARNPDGSLRQAAQSWPAEVDSAWQTGSHLIVTMPPHQGSARFLFQPAPGETLDYALESQGMAVPAVLRQVAGLEEFARAQTRNGVGGVVGPSDHLATAEFIASLRAEGWRRLPSTPFDVKSLWRTIARVRGEQRAREIVDPKLERGVVTVFMKDANFRDTRSLMDALRDYARRHLEPERIRMDFAGDVAVSQTLIQSIVTTQVGSIGLSLLGILVVTALIFRSLRWGAICTVPAAFAVAATFAVMGWAGIPLGVATSMFAAMVLGIGVDFAIHLVERYRMGVARGVASERAVEEALAATAPAISINALAVGLGFGFLMLSQVPANARLGALTMLSLAACLVATLIVIPALLRLGRGGRSSPA